MLTGRFIGQYCHHDQYRCYHNLYGHLLLYIPLYHSYYLRDNYLSFFSVCINSTLACNGQFDCSFGTSDEEGCGCFLEILTTVLYTCIYNIQRVLLHVQRYMWTFCISATIQRIVLILNTEEVIELYYVRICCASIILVFLTLFLLLISTMHSLPNCI